MKFNKNQNSLLTSIKNLILLMKSIDYLKHDLKISDILNFDRCEYALIWSSRVKEAFEK